MMLEVVFCGRARLTRAFIDAGFSAMGIDSKRNRHSPQGPCLTLDLTEPAESDPLWKLLELHNVVFYSFGAALWYILPCARAAY